MDSVGSADLTKALERGWGRMLLGPMERLKAEEGKGFCSQQFAAWAQGYDIKLDSVRPWPPKKRDLPACLRGQGKCNKK